MKYKLFQLWGPFAIHSYGLCIGLGLIIFTLLVMRDKRFAYLKLEHSFSKIVAVGIAATLFGGRILYLLSESEHPFVYTDLIDFWQGGLSILGGILGILLIVPFYLRSLHIPILPFFDLVAVYSGLLQAIARVGCFFAGCCFGSATRVPWAIIYTDPLCAAPLHTSIHPAPLYSAFLSLCIFVAIKYHFQYVLKKPGELTCVYIILTAVERFIVDFWRADRIMTSTAWLSYNQWVALALLCGSSVMFFYLSRWAYKTQHA